jgi:CDP-glucose 4,6-dehydratase
MATEYEAVYRGRRVLLTGHTGFKGGWLAHWLAALGADVTGFSLAPDAGRPNLFSLSGVERIVRSHIGDIRDMAAVAALVDASAPEVIFHLAAQPLVRRSYAEPLETFSTNVMGTAHILEAARASKSVRAVVCVTTDKVYSNKEWLWGYREIDPLGGKDPYSASKAACELVAQAYAGLYELDKRVMLATARGGNVIGGGDWSRDRIVVDIVEAVAARRPIVLRNPSAVRPWQHALELCRSYLLLGAQLLDRQDTALGAWNFGPGPESEVTRRLVVACGGDPSLVRIEQSSLVEAMSLRLDTSKSRQVLGWQPVLDFAETIGWTAEWYREHASGARSAVELTNDQLARYRARLQ